MLGRASVSGRGSAYLLAACAVVAAIWMDSAWAQGSLGIGRPEQAIRPEGPFASALFWIQHQQQDYYRSLTDALTAMRTDGAYFWLLAWLSFAYGVFHAAGPGHGKAVISSYLIANEVAARRGIVLAFASAMLQAITAIALIAVLVFTLRGAGYRQGELTRWLEIASYAGVTLLGAWLLYSKLAGSRNARLHRHGAAHHERECLRHNHLHAPDPGALADHLSMRQAWTAIVAVGLRPCSGAIIVLTFAFLNGLYFAGIAAAFAMALGTGLTVAILAALAVWSKDLAIALGRTGDRADRVLFWIEIAGATLVFLLGLTLLTASLY